MSANLPLPSINENVSTTLSTGISDVAATMDVADASLIVSPCYLVIDQHDSLGALRSTAFWEYVKVTNVGGNTLTITRAQGGSTGQAHTAGAVIEAVVTSSMFEDWYNALNPEHTSTGGHVITGTMTIAGMNLLSVATIASLSAGIVNFPATASITGIPLVPVFAFVGTLSGSTVSPQTALPLPRNGTWNYANFITRTTASGVSAIVDMRINGTSIFDTIGRPMIAAGGTFASTASIKTKSFVRGDRLTWDYSGTGGTITDFDVILVSL